MPAQAAAAMAETFAAETTIITVQELTNAVRALFSPTTQPTETPTITNK